MFLVRSQPGGEVTLCLLVTIASPTVLEMTNSAEGGGGLTDYVGVPEGKVCMRPV